MKENMTMVQFGITQVGTHDNARPLTNAEAIAEAQRLLREEGYEVGDEFQIEDDTCDDAHGGLVVLLEVDDYCWLELEDAGILEFHNDKIELSAEMP